MLNKLKIYSQAITTRKMLGESDTSPIDVFAVVQSIEHLSLILFPMSDNISGMCVRVGKETVIAVNSSMSLGRQNFSIAHELYHFYYDDTQTTAICSKKIGVGNEIERAADCFASFFLMPDVSDFGVYNNDNLTFKAIIALEQYYKTSNQAMIYRLVGENLLSSSQSKNYLKDVTKVAASLGYDTSLYKPSREEKKYKTYGYYIKQTQNLSEKNLVSDGKIEQLLIEAFRSDLVYGDETEWEEIND